MRSQRGLAALCQGYDSANADTVKKVNRFLKDIKQKKKTSPAVLTWLFQMRGRKNLKASTFKAALEVTLDSHRKKNIGINIMESKVSSINHKLVAHSQSLPSITHQGIAVTAQNVVNFLYQGLLDVTYILQKMLGEGKFDENRQLPENCQGEVLLLWGSHLGAVREQAFLAHDYDVDIGVFLRADYDFNEIRDITIKTLKKMNYQSRVHKQTKRREQHIKIGPSKACNFRASMERYQDTKIRNPTLPRPKLMALTKRKKDAGHFKKLRFIGINVIDVAFYVVHAKRDIHLSDAGCQSIAFDKVFPSKVGYFGPYSLSIPRTTELLTSEYGEDCLTTPRLKKNRSNYVTLPEDMRRASWPSKILDREYNYRYLPVI